jgi:two-component system, OmpR family, sensor kinase
VERLQRLIEELLELARIDAGQERELPEPIAACEIVKAAIAAVREEAPRRAVAIAVESSSELLLNAALVAAKIALANILDNAVKFSPAGGRVTINVAANGKEAVIAVSDNGPEVAPDDLRWLFQRFYRGNASRSTGAPGVGLGLAISRALVERQGGRISVQAERERGATFGVHLPRA